MRLTGRIAVTLTRRHSDPDGWLTAEGESWLWQTLGGAPKGAQVRLDVGSVRYPSQRAVHLLVDVLGPGGIDCPDLVIEGHAACVGHWLEEIRMATTQPAAAAPNPMRWAA